MTETAHDQEGPSMTPTYVAVLVVEVLIIVALWALGRMFS
jgi:hypothetical protein